MKYDVYGVGNALVDIQAQVTDEIVASTQFEKGIMTLVDDQQQLRIACVVRQYQTRRPQDPPLIAPHLFHHTRRRLGGDASPVS